MCNSLNVSFQAGTKISKLRVYFLISQSLIHLGNYTGSMLQSNLSIKATQGTGY